MTLWFDLSKVLQTLATMPNRRDVPLPGDLEGEFEFWFDGGAARVVTGHTEYVLSDGVRAQMPIVPLLSMYVGWPDGRVVHVQQVSSALHQSLNVEDPEAG